MHLTSPAGTSVRVEPGGTRDEVELCEYAGTGRLVGFSGLLNGSLVSHPAKVEAVRKAIERGFAGAQNSAQAETDAETSPKQKKPDRKTPTEERRSPRRRRRRPRRRRRRRSPSRKAPSRRAPGRRVPSRRVPSRRRGRADAHPAAQAVHRHVRSDRRRPFPSGRHQPRRRGREGLQRGPVRGRSPVRRRQDHARRHGGRSAGDQRARGARHRDHQCRGHRPRRGRREVRHRHQGRFHRRHRQSPATRTQDRVETGLIIGPGTEAIAGEHLVATAGAIDPTSTSSPRNRPNRPSPTASPPSSAAAPARRTVRTGRPAPRARTTSPGCSRPRRASRSTSASWPRATAACRRR